ncbi:hypothetical protein Q5752_003357 [Cryptotrichosporon argae]
MAAPLLPGLSRRRVDPDLGDQIIAPQRRSAGGARARRERDEYRRDDHLRERSTDYDRGTSGSTRKQLFDPSAPLPPPPRRSERAAGSGTDDERRRRPPPDLPRRVEQGKKLFDPDAPLPRRRDEREPGPSRRLFDPADPYAQVELQPKPVRNLLLDQAGSRTPEEEADRERERRRRREGSERGSQAGKRKDKDADARSRGSRSSEGSESFKDRERGRGEGDSGAKKVLREAYKQIQTLEQTLVDMHRKLAADPDAGISAIMKVPAGGEDEVKAWAELVAMHKELAEHHHEFLKIAFDPTFPSGLRVLPVKYNIPVRLWQSAFHLVLERLRFLWTTKNPIALDLLTDCILDAYRFYTELYDDPLLGSFRTAWIEALGDIARYRMAVASVAAEPPMVRRTVDDDDDDAPQPSGVSIGQEVADDWVVNDKDTWRETARDWYAMGVTEKPGEGRLHHHLALLCHNVRGLEGRELYHFTKSLTASHPFETSRESILALFDSSLQLQRSTPEATAMDLFVRLHGMLFTRIDLDAFPPVMSRFMERLEEDASLDGVSRKAGVTQVDWLLMSAVNIAAVLQYGALNSPIRKALVAGGRRRNQDDDEPDDEVEHEEVDPEPDAPPPQTFTFALQLASAMLDLVFAHPTRHQGLHQVLNPYLTTYLTFLATLFRVPEAGAHVARYVSWRNLATFLGAFRDVREETRLISAAAPLPEDWMVRGMEWVGRRVYERGFWKAKLSSGRGSSGGLAQPRSGERFQSEVDVLTARFESALDVSEGVVEAVEGTDLTDGPVAIDARRRKRVIWAAGVLCAHVDGLSVEDGVVRIASPLEERIRAIEEERAI